MTELMHCAAKQDHDYARELLDAEPWNNTLYVMSGLRGYTQALDSRTNWLAEQERLMEVVGRRWEQGFSDPKEEKTASMERSQVNLAVASGWVHSDPQAALSWYRNLHLEDSVQGTLASRTIRILSQLQPTDRFMAANWFEQEMASGQNHDELIVQYARGLPIHDIDPVVERLISLPTNDQSREQILNAYFATRKQGGKHYLRANPELLTRLVRASGMTPEQQEPWLQKAAETPHIGALSQN